MNCLRMGPCLIWVHRTGADLVGGCRGCAPPPSPPPPSEITCGFLIQLVFWQKKTVWFIGAEVEQEMSAPPPRKNPGSAPVEIQMCIMPIISTLILKSLKSAYV